MCVCACIRSMYSVSNRTRKALLSSFWPLTYLSLAIIVPLSHTVADYPEPIL